MGANRACRDSLTVASVLQEKDGVRLPHSSVPIKLNPDLSGDHGDWTTAFLS